MSFQEFSDCFVWSCDGKDCDLKVVFKPHDFMACVAELKSRGWQFCLDEETGHEGWGRDWRHYCQKCERKRRRTSILDQVPGRAVKAVK